MTESVYLAGTRIYAGRFYKLLHQVGPIPAGIYRGEGCIKNEYHFSVGEDRTIRFSLENLDCTLISQVAFSIGKARATKREEFISCYFSSSNSDRTGLHESLCAQAPRLINCVIRFAKQPQHGELGEVLTSASTQNFLSTN